MELGNFRVCVWNLILCFDAYFTLWRELDRSEFPESVVAPVHFWQPTQSLPSKSWQIGGEFPLQLTFAVTGEYCNEERRVERWLLTIRWSGRLNSNNEKHRQTMVKTAITNRVHPRPTSFSKACRSGTSGTNPVGLQKHWDDENLTTLFWLP